MQTAEVISRLKAVEPQLRAFGVDRLYLRRRNLDPLCFWRKNQRMSSLTGRPRSSRTLDAFVGAYDVLKSALPVDVDYGTRTGLSKLIRDQVEREAIRIF
jgi:uncharacterized protein